MPIEKMDFAYFMEKCPIAVSHAWQNDWVGAMNAFFCPRAARAWDALLESDRTAVLDSLRAKFGQTILVGTMGDNLYYIVERRMQLISVAISEDLLKPRAIKNLVFVIVSHAVTDTSKLVYPPAGFSHPLHRTSQYVNAYPYLPQPPAGPPPEESVQESQEEPQEEPEQESQEEPQEDPEQESQEDPEQESQEEFQEDPVQDSQEDPVQESKDQVSEARLTIRMKMPASAPNDTDVEESEEESEDEEAVCRDLLADTDDETEPVTRPAPLPEVGDITVSMKVVMFHRYMMFLGNTKLVRINPLPAIQVRLSPSEFADLQIRFRELENATADGWWISNV